MLCSVACQSDWLRLGVTRRKILCARFLACRIWAVPGSGSSWWLVRQLHYCSI
jgi:hypothetical protein